MAETSKEDCLACRLVSTAAGLGIGSYLIYQGRQIPGWGKPIYSLLGISFYGLGFARLFNYRPPFFKD